MLSKRSVFSTAIKLPVAEFDVDSLCHWTHTSGGEIEQIQFLLGHASVQTTERYLGCKQNLGHPVNDLFRLGNITVARQVSSGLEGEVLHGKVNCRQTDTMSVNECRIRWTMLRSRAG